MYVCKCVCIYISTYTHTDAQTHTRTHARTHLVGHHIAARVPTRKDSECLLHEARDPAGPLSIERVCNCCRLVGLIDG